VQDNGSNGRITGEYINDIRGILHIIMPNTAIIFQLQRKKWNPPAKKKRHQAHKPSPSEQRGRQQQLQLPQHPAVL
jgi:hypothetical protein